VSERRFSETDPSNGRKLAPCLLPGMDLSHFRQDLQQREDGFSGNFPFLLLFPLAEKRNFVKMERVVKCRRFLYPVCVFDERRS